MKTTEDAKGGPDDKNLVNAGEEKRNGTELIGSNGSDLPEKHDKFTTQRGVRLKVQSTDE